MEDDFSFGNVWGDASSPKPLPATLLATTAKPVAASEPPSASDDFDDFTDFGQPSASSSALTSDASQTQEEDDFGDFGAFDEAPVVTEDLGGFDDDGFDAPVGFTPSQPSLGGQSTSWRPATLDPLPDDVTLSEDVDELLGPFWSATLARDVLSDEGIRQVEGLGQTLVTSESRALYNVLYEASLPTVRPPNWTRSRIRRQHLISLGIPINLDEVLEPYANGKPLPALHITTRPSSAPPTPRPAAAPVAIPQGSVTRSSTPKPSRPSSKRNTSSGVESLPTLDQAKVDEMLSLDPETLPLLPLPVLNAHLDSLRSLTATTSSILTHLLQTRESLQQESEVLNGAIADLISKETQKLKTGSRLKPAKRGSVM